MTFTGERQNIIRWAESKGEQGIKDYDATHNRQSIDGLPTGR